MKKVLILAISVMSNLLLYANDTTNVSTTPNVCPELFSVLKNEDIIKSQASNITQLLSGQMAGVQAITPSGQPGTISSLRIRGIGSMDALCEPLYVIDGIPSNPQEVSTLSNSDIESVHVLKDAMATALYGMRGANGVILITTRCGDSEKIKVSVDAKWGTNQRAVPNYDVIKDPRLYYETAYKALYSNYAKNYSASEADRLAYENLLNYTCYTVPDGERLIGTNGKINPNATLGYITSTGNMIYPDDWEKEVFGKGNFRQEYNLSLSGSTNKTNYLASASYLDDAGIIDNSNFKRITTRINADFHPTKWLKFGTKMSYANAKMNYPAEDSYGSQSSANIFYMTNFIAPIYPLYLRDSEGNKMKDEHGFLYDYGDFSSESRRHFMLSGNPISENKLNKALYQKNHFNGKYFLDLELYNGLSLTANLGVINQHSNHEEMQNPYYDHWATSGGYLAQTTKRVSAVNQQYMIAYNNCFADLHQVDLILRYENYQYKYRSTYTYQTIYHPYDSRQSTSTELTNFSANYKTQSLFMQAQYAFANRYFVYGSYNRNSTSRFTKEHRWGDFWAVGLTWSLKGEPFLQNVSQISSLKIKTSYGKVGNDGLATIDGIVSYDLTEDKYKTTEANGIYSSFLTSKGNKDITYENSYHFNGGIEFSLFDNRLNATMEGWKKRTTNMYFYKPQPSSVSYKNYPTNDGELSNVGVDIALSGVPYQSKNVRWDIFFTLSSYKNKIVKISEAFKKNGIKKNNYIYREGESLYNLHLKSYAGVHKQTGKSLWYLTPEDNKTKITSLVYEALYCETGDILPKAYGGFGTNLIIYGVDFGITFNYQLGGKIYDNGYRLLMHGGIYDIGTNWHKDILNAWTAENPNTNVPAFDENVNVDSDRFLISSNYLSLQNITLGYTLPEKWLEKIHVKKVRLYAVADNVVLFSKRQGLDPRQDLTMYTGCNYAIIRSISGGINIIF